MGTYMHAGAPLREGAEAALQLVEALRLTTWLLMLNWVPGNALWVGKGSTELFQITKQLTHIHTDFTSYAGFTASFRLLYYTYTSTRNKNLYCLF